MDAIYRVEGNRVITSPNAAGPWDPGMQHGSAPASLVVWAAEAIPAAVPMRIARVTIDLCDGAAGRCEGLFRPRRAKPRHRKTLDRQRASPPTRQMRSGASGRQCLTTDQAAR